ncbi:MAG: hypothetical protein JXB00_15500 [Bacteroidales bacterium]|nr:hypothetical protein [Bacteroidales bacterium]
MRKYLFFTLSVFCLLTNSSKSLSQDLANLPNQKPFIINGSLNAKLQFYDSDRPNPGRNPFVWYLQGSPVVTLYGIVLPFSFRLSEQQRDFRQPFNQFGVSPYYKWIKVHLGYRSLNWSTYALAGHSISGAGVELTPGKFRVGLISGRLLKPVKYIDNPEAVSIQTPAYRRTGTAFTLGYGDEKNNVNLVILKAKDDSTSTGEVPLKYQLTPDENLVISFVSKQVIAEKFLFELEVAQSIYTKDMRTELSDSSDGFLVKTLSSLIENHQSTSSNNAFQTAFGYQSDIFNLMLKYQRIEPDFKSMGAYYFLTDLRNITIEPSVKLFKKKLTLGGSFGTQVDNLKNDKNLRTRRNISSVKMNFVPVPQYNLNAFYSNYGLAQESGLLSIDTLRNTEVAQATNQFGITQSLNLTGEKLAHNLMLNFNYQKLNDRNENTSQFSEFTTNIFSAGYFLNYLPWNLNASVSLLSTKFIQDTLETVVLGPSLGIGKSFLKNKLNAGINYSSMKNEVQNQKEGTINTFTFQLGYKPVKNQRFAIRFYHNKNKGQRLVSNSYFENKLDLDYTLSF